MCKCHLTPFIGSNISTLRLVAVLFSPTLTTKFPKHTTLVCFRCNRPKRATLSLSLYVCLSDIILPTPINQLAPFAWSCEWKVIDRLHCFLHQYYKNKDSRDVCRFFIAGCCKAVSQFSSSEFVYCMPTGLISYQDFLLIKEVLRFKFLTTELITMEVFWDVPLCWQINSYRRCREAYSFLLRVPNTPRRPSS
jgi:hypothetical protein